MRTRGKTVRTQGKAEKLPTCASDCAVWSSWVAWEERGRVTSAVGRPVLWVACARAPCGEAEIRWASAAAGSIP